MRGTDPILPRPQERAGSDRPRRPRAHHARAHLLSAGGGVGRYRGEVPMKMPYAIKKLRSMLGELRRGKTGIITRVATAEPVAALTFDDGPHPVFTPRLLDILERHQARATFFMVGQNAYRHPE